MLNKESVVDKFIIKSICTLSIILLFWMLESFIFMNNECSNLCEQNGYNDFIATEDKSKNTWKCTCVKEDEDNKYFLDIDMKTGKKSMVERVSKIK